MLVDVNQSNWVLKFSFQMKVRSEVRKLLSHVQKHEQTEFTASWNRIEKTHKKCLKFVTQAV